MGKIIGLDALQSAVQGKLEPIHEINTVTGTNGSITITNALDAPLISFTAAGMTPQVFSTDGIGAQMGEQTWDNPMCLDVPIGIVNANIDVVVLGYGNGVGSNNTWSFNSGEDIGENVYYTSKDLANLFKEVENDDSGTVTNEGDGYYLFACPLPFSVAENSVVYCSHLQNKNVSGEDGIWASGSTLYIRAHYSHPGDQFGKFASYIDKIASNCNLYNPMNPIGTDPSNFMDFFIYLTASASYTKQGKEQVVVLDNGTHTLSYFKISDYIGAVSEMWAPNPTSISQMTAVYYDASTINAYQKQFIDTTVRSKFGGPAAFGKDAVAGVGGAVGEGAQETYGGGAVGYYAKAATGGAMGVNASSVNGQGGAIGMGTVAHDGGAVGYYAKTSQGCAIGRYAICKDSNDDPIDAIQLGSGTNTTSKTMQVYNYQMMDANGKIPYARLPQDEIEPAHKTQTVTAANGTIAVQNALDAPFVKFAVAGTGLGPVVIQDVIGTTMGNQSWDNPMILNAPLLLAAHKDNFMDTLASVRSLPLYGAGTSVTNSYDIPSGVETGTDIYLNSRAIADLLDEVDNAETGNIVDEGMVGDNKFYRFEIPLPFTVADNSVIRCSHLKNQNISGEEGIWASGNTLYIRSYHLNNEFSKAAGQLRKYSNKINYYSPMVPRGSDNENFCDFFIYLIASTSFTREHGENVVPYSEDLIQSYDWITIEDYIQLFKIGEPPVSSTSLTNISATYYTDITVNQNLINTISNMFVGGLTDGSLGMGAVSEGGGAVGTYAVADDGGAVGVGALARSGGAIGGQARASSGAAVGFEATAGEGVALGSQAKCASDANGEIINAIQFGEGTNSTAGSMQVYSTPVLIPNSNNSGLIIPAALLIASVGAMTTQELTDFKDALGLS